MSVCGKCEAEIDIEAKVYVCPDCSTTFHHDCQNIDSGICPVCAICGIAPTQAIERKKVELSFQRKGERPSAETAVEMLVIEHNVNEQFDEAPVEKQVELINKAIKKKPRKLVQSKGILKNKHAFIGVLGVVTIGLVRAGLQSGEWFPFMLAGVVALGTFIWWASN